MSRVKISSGSFKGRTVGSRKIFSSRAGADQLRPTSAKVREALFSILQSVIPGAVFVDMFAGTGAIGIEALSRGAKRVYFVEANRSRAIAIRDFLEKNEISASAEVYHGTADGFLARQSPSLGSVDVIFLDPPYGSGELDTTIETIDRLVGGTKEEIILVAEHSAKKSMPLRLPHLLLKKQYKYGDTMLTLYTGAPI